MGRPDDPGLGRKSGIRLHVSRPAMSSHAALIGAALISGYMALVSGVQWVEAVRSDQEQGQEK